MSGSSGIKIYSTVEPDFPLVQTLEKVHRLGSHHVATSNNGEVAATAGFGGEVIIWSIQEGLWTEQGKIVGATLCVTETFQVYYNTASDGNKAGEIWAIALSENGQYLASTAIDGRINVWDNFAGRAKIREFETEGSYGMAIDLVRVRPVYRFLLTNLHIVTGRKIYSVRTREWRHLHFQQ